MQLWDFSKASTPFELIYSLDLFYILLLNILKLVELHLRLRRIIESFLFKSVPFKCWFWDAAFPKRRKFMPQTSPLDRQCIQRTFNNRYAMT